LFPPPSNHKYTHSYQEHQGSVCVHTYRSKIVPRISFGERQIKTIQKY